MNTTLAVLIGTCVFILSLTSLGACHEHELTDRTAIEHGLVQKSQNGTVWEKPH